MIQDIQDGNLNTHPYCRWQLIYGSDVADQEAPTHFIDK
jgi:hypothetical protein